MGDATDEKKLIAEDHIRALRVLEEAFRKEIERTASEQANDVPNQEAI